MNKQLKGNDCSRFEAIEILKQYIQEQYDLVERKEISEDSFSTPNWSEFQAYICGYKKALKKVQEFLPDQGDK